jgi:hypothetical protein
MEQLWFAFSLVLDDGYNVIERLFFVDFIPLCFVKLTSIVFVNFSPPCDVQIVQCSAQFIANQR